MEKGSLKEILKEGSLSWDRVLHSLKSISRGMSFLHASNIIHRDLKASNVLVNENWAVRIADFGLSRIKLVNQTMTVCGSIAWIAPEVLRKSHYSDKADVYSFGCVMFEILTRSQPFFGLPTMRIASRVVNGETPPIPPELPTYPGTSQYLQVMHGCWAQDPNTRPAFRELDATFQQFPT
eukprot:TRINITY_DN2495_c0_g1_i4.p1 TRINITY_DN2495_c0_g1~~TRINITY_DN2495_c0_g1_i4.p1  ORF type:complete len:211 (+),score=7.58 TRINITY_DN2495_c0_g1_i4:96-635(+)